MIYLLPQNLLREGLNKAIGNAAGAGKQVPTLLQWWMGVRYTAGSDGVAMWSWVNGEEFNEKLPYVLSYMLLADLDLNYSLYTFIFLS